MSSYIGLFQEMKYNEVRVFLPKNRSTIPAGCVYMENNFSSFFSVHAQCLRYLHFVVVREHEKLSFFSPHSPCISALLKNRGQAAAKSGACVQFIISRYHQLTQWPNKWHFLAFHTLPRYVNLKNISLALFRKKKLFSTSRKCKFGSLEMKILRRKNLCRNSKWQFCWMKHFCI